MGHKKKKRIRIHREGRGIIATLTLLIFAVNVPLFMYMPNWVGAVTLVLSAALLVFVTYFFRNPTRIVEVSDDKILVAPADGRIVVIEPTVENEYFHDRRVMVSIFMSLFNVHANWIPSDGVIKKVEHHNGNFHKAWLPKASIENERSTIVITTPDGTDILVTVIEWMSFCERITSSFSA